MKKLCELVDVVINNENCVVFKVKNDVAIDLISLGCFKGTEDMIRMTKGKTPEITVFNKDGSNYSYHFGEGSTTIISENMVQQRTMIRECTILDYGIVCDWSHMGKDNDYYSLVRETMSVKTMDDAKRLVTLVSGGGKSGNIRVNEQGMALSVHVKDIPAWFEKRGYKVEFPYDISKGLPCGRVYGMCEPVVSEKEFGVNDISQERYAVLLGNVISFLSKDYDNDKFFYDFLYDEIGMSNEEIKAIGCGNYIPKDVDTLLSNATAKAEEINTKNDVSLSLDNEPQKDFDLEDFS